MVDAAAFLQEEELPWRPRSWPVRLGVGGLQAGKVAFGLLTLLVLLALAASLPVIQFASFGYLLWASGRVAASGRLRDGVPGFRQASSLGGILLGSWLSLLPARLLSDSWYAAWLIDPDSGQTQGLRLTLLVLVGATIVHLLAALACGGKLRFFVWPLVAPVQWGLWLGQGLFCWPVFRQVVDQTLGRLFPKLISDLRSLRPLQDWFPPSVLWKEVRQGGWLQRSGERLWGFWQELRIPMFWWLGLRGAIGTLIWLLPPAVILIAAANRNDGLGGLLALVGIPCSAAVFALLLQMQTRYAWKRDAWVFVQPLEAVRQFGRAPLAAAVCGWLALLLAVPMFLLKVEAVPTELEWVLALVFVGGAWPARILLGWAAARANRQTQARRWWWRYLGASFLLVGCGLFSVILLLTRYLSWRGAGSLLENHLFLLPTPFWLN